VGRRQVPQSHIHSATYPPLRPIMCAAHLTSVARVVPPGNCANWKYGLGLRPCVFCVEIEFLGAGALTGDDGGVRARRVSRGGGTSRGGDGGARGGGARHGRLAIFGRRGVCGHSLDAAVLMMTKLAGACTHFSSQSTYIQ
jgi:hypothetical protein